MKTTMTILVALTLGVSSAQTTAPQTTNVALPGKIPASVTRTYGDALQTLLKSGGKVELLNASGAVIGTLNADGTVALVSGASLSDAKTVRVTQPTTQGQTAAQPTNYTLTRDLAKPGAIKLQWTQNGRTLSLPLSAIANRKAGQTQTTPTTTAPTTTAPTPTAPTTGTPDDDGDKGSKPEKPEKPENPGKGKGKGK